jgi:hypothetical protein
MYFVTKIEVQTQSRKKHTKMITFKCMCIIYKIKFMGICFVVVEEVHQNFVIDL